jgi:hypothetical protein
LNLGGLSCHPTELHPESLSVRSSLVLVLVFRGSLVRQARLASSLQSSCLKLPPTPPPVKLGFQVWNGCHHILFNVRILRPHLERAGFVVCSEHTVMLIYPSADFSMYNTCSCKTIPELKYTSPSGE